MQFQSADPSVVKSIRQRVLLNAWLRALRRPKPLPSLLDFKPERINDDELADMMGFNVEGDGEARALRDHPRRIAADRDLWQRSRRSGEADQPLSRRRHRSGPLCARGAVLPRLHHAEAADLFGLDGAGMATARTSPMSGCCCRSARGERGRADRRLLQGDQHRGRLQGQQPDGAAARQPACRRHQCRDRSGVARRPVALADDIVEWSEPATSSLSLPWHRSPA